MAGIADPKRTVDITAFATYPVRIVHHVVLLALLAFVAIWVVALVDMATHRDISTGQRLVMVLLLIFVWPIGVAGWLVLRGSYLRRRPILTASALLGGGVVAFGLWASVALVAGHSQAVQVRAVPAAPAPPPPVAH